MNKQLYISGLCLWFVREIEKIDVVGLGQNQSSLPPGFVTYILAVQLILYTTGIVIDYVLVLNIKGQHFCYLLDDELI